MILMTIPRGLHFHRPFTCPFAHLFLERLTDLVPDQAINLRTDDVGSVVSYCLLNHAQKIRITWAPALEFAR